MPKRGILEDEFLKDSTVSSLMLLGGLRNGRTLNLLMICQGLEAQPRKIAPRQDRVWRRISLTNRHLASMNLMLEWSKKASFDVSSVNTKDMSRTWYEGTGSEVKTTPDKVRKVVPTGLDKRVSIRNR